MTLFHVLETTPHLEDVRWVIILPPTSPVRDDGSLDEAIALYSRTGCDSLVSVVEGSALQWRISADKPEPLYDVGRRPLRQCVEQDQRRFYENGSIVITSVQSLLGTGNRLGGRIAMYVMQPHEGIDIDVDYDLWLAEQWLRRTHAG